MTAEPPHTDLARTVIKLGNIGWWAVDEMLIHDSTIPRKEAEEAVRYVEEHFPDKERNKVIKAMSLKMRHTNPFK